MADFEVWAAKYMGIVDMLTAFIPYKRTKVWREFLLSPASVALKDDVGIVGRLKDIYVMTAVNFLMTALMMLPALAISGVAFGGMAILSCGIGPLSLALIAAGTIAIYVITPIGYFLYSLLELVIAKALGGSGSMKANFSASVLPILAIFLLELPILAIMIPLQWLSAVPVVSICASCIGMVPLLIMMAMGLYSLFLKYEGMKAVHKLSPMRAAAVVMIPMLLIWVLMFVVMLAVYAAMYTYIIGMTTVTVVPTAGSA
jgi:hypothetical protein